MPIGSGIVYNTGDLILSQVSSSGTAFLETKIASATSSLIYFDSTARINSASLNSITVGTASYVSGSTSIITNLTASNISASGTSSFGIVGIGTTAPGALLHVYGDTPTIRVQGNSVASAKVDLVGTYTTWSLENQYVNGANNDMFRIYNSALSADAITINRATNNVGIGTTSPTARLHVSGSTGGVFEVDTAGGTTTLYVSASGNVGIGTTGPAQKLDVRGYVVSDVGSNAVEGGFYLGNGSHGLRRPGGSSNDVYLYTTSGTLYMGASGNSSQHLTILTGGNVGIGTTNPGYLFTVKGGAAKIIGSHDNNSGIYLASTATDRPLVSFRVSDDSERAKIEINNINNANGDRLGFFVYSPTGLSERVSILGNGNVGIGTTSPDSLLHLNKAVTAGSNNFVLRLQNPTTVSDARVGILFSDNADTGSNADGAFIQVSNNGVDGGGNMFFGKILDTTTTTNVTFLSTGNVGIGTTVPAYLLDVSGSSRHGYRTSDAHYFTGSVNISGSLNATASWATNALTASYLVPTNSYTITNLTASNVSASGTGSFGIIGIGTNSPTQKLHVVGNVLSSYNILTSVVKISSASDAASYISVDGYTAGLSYAGTYIGLASLPGFAVFANLYIGGGFPIIPAGWSGTISGIAYANAVSLASSVLLQTSPDGSTWTTRSQTSAPSGTETLTYSVSDSATPLYVRFTLRQDSGGTVAANDCNIQNIIITNLQSLPNKPSISNRFIVNGAGNVGIGTTIPAYLLDVSGSSRHGYRTSDAHYFTGSVSISGSLNATASWATNALTASFLPVGTYNITSSWAQNVVTASYLVPTNSYTITNLTASNISASSTGSFGIVGIGTTSPAYKLDVAGSIYGYNYFTLLTAATYGPSDNSAAMQVFGSTGSGGLTNTIKFVTGGSERWRITDAGILQSPAGQTIQTSTGNLTLATAGGNGHILLSPNGSGNVGIGTTSPNQKLSIYPGTTGGIALQDSGGTTRSYFFIDNTNPIYSTGIRTENYYLDFDSSGGAQNAIRFYTGTSTIGTGTERMRITSGGNVGIGTTSPTARLHVSGSTGGVFEVDTAGGATTLYVSASGNVGIGTTSPAYKLDLSTTLTGTTVGSNVVLNIESQASGRDVEIRLGDTVNSSKRLGYLSGNFYIASGTTENFRIDTNGNVGIGTTVPAYLLDVSGSSRHGYRTSDAHYFTGSVNISGSLNATASWANNVVSASYATTAQTANALNVSNTYTVAGLTSGNVNVTGTTIPSTGIYRPASKTLGLSADTTLILKIDGTGAPYVTSIESGNFLVSGDVGIGTAAPGAKLEISGSSNSALLNIKSPISGAILYVSGSGAVGIGTTAVGAFTLQVSGSFGATTKSFIIDHPTKAGKKLMYGSLESPYHGIRLTGRDTLVNGKCKIQLPDYMYKLILHDSVNIQLTGIKCNKTLYIDDINIPENYFTIAYDKAIFESYKDYDFFWDFTAIRADVPELITEL